MSDTLFQRQLAKFGACSEAREWVGDKTARVAWETCERPDWLFWLANAVGVDRKTIVLAACACARTALRFVPEGEVRHLQAIELAERCARGDSSVTLEDVRRAASASASAAAYDAARRECCRLIRQHITFDTLRAASNPKRDVHASP
jgi:hypothetical protein